MMEMNVGMASNKLNEALPSCPMPPEIQTYGRAAFEIPTATNRQRRRILCMSSFNENGVRRDHCELSLPVPQQVINKGMGGGAARPASTRSCGRASG